MAGSLVTINHQGKIIRRFALPDNPREGYYPLKTAEGTVHFFPGAKPATFQLGRYLPVSPPAVGHCQPLLQGETS